MAESITSFSGFLDAILEEHYEIDPDDTADSAYALIRKQLTTKANQAVSKLWSTRDFPWKQVQNAEVVVPATTFPNLPVVSLPAAWGNMGWQGNVHRKDDPLGTVHWRRLGWIIDRLNRLEHTDAPVLYYSVRGLYELIVADRPAAATTLYVSYEKKRPAFTDGSPGGITDIPEHWILPFLWPETLWRQCQSDGDLQAVPTLKAQAQEALYDIVCVEDPGKPEMRFFPRYPGAVGLNDWD